MPNESTDMVWIPNNQVDKVIWPVDIHWYDRQRDDMATVAELEVLHGSKNMDSHVQRPI